MTGKVPWEVVKASLVARGLWDEDGISRKARGRLCKSCRAPVLAGLDHDRCAMAVFLDPSPINALGEAMALIAGRPTYSLRWHSDHYEIDVRYAEHISASPAGSNPKTEILAAHVCGAAPLPNSMRGQQLAGPATPGAASDEPPF